MDDRFRKERYIFRFLGLSTAAMEELRRLAGAELEVRPHYSTGDPVVSFELADDRDYSALVEFVSRQKLPENSYGLYVSLVTEHDIDGVHVADFAARLFRRTGGTIDFSCTRV